MSLPVNFSQRPSEENHRYFRNLLIEFRKKIENSSEIEELQDEMERFLNACKQLEWRHKTAAEKAIGKVWNEFKRYIFNLLRDVEGAHPQELLEALGEIERLATSLEAR